MLPCHPQRLRSQHVARGARSVYYSPLGHATDCSTHHAVYIVPGLYRRPDQLQQRQYPSVLAAKYAAYAAVLLLKLASVWQLAQALCPGADVVAVLAAQLVDYIDPHRGSLFFSPSAY